MPLYLLIIDNTPIIAHVINCKFIIRDFCAIDYTSIIVGRLGCQYTPGSCEKDAANAPRVRMSAMASCKVLIVLVLQARLHISGAEEESGQMPIQHLFLTGSECSVYLFVLILKINEYDVKQTVICFIFVVKIFSSAENGRKFLARK